ncbi:hypothetical protein CER18_04285 [Bartonella tribocorum]|uniref:Uncharacterized protein n=1 Tax=Bartonella tribocorum TaxID=85701 RepID=A0A2M6USY4_9HYPH|nr:hypothetical protein CER18_04285 [Bartonella tribocorum]
MHVFFHRHKPLLERPFRKVLLILIWNLVDQQKMITKLWGQPISKNLYRLVLWLSFVKVSFFLKSHILDTP